MPNGSMIRVDPDGPDISEANIVAVMEQVCAEKGVRLDCIDITGCPAITTRYQGGVAIHVHPCWTVETRVKYRKDWFTLRVYAEKLRQTYQQWLGELMSRIDALDKT